MRWKEKPRWTNLPYYCLKKKMKESARREFSMAQNNINTAKSVAEEPFTDPKRLEYYLFEYDPRYVKESAFKYCVKRRNEYLRKLGLAVPYSENILDDEAAG